MKLSVLIGLITWFTSTGGYPAIREGCAHSEEFYLVAYKIPENRLDQDATFYQMTRKLQDVGFQPLVYNQDHEIVLDSNIDSKAFNVTGVINKDLSAKLTRFPQPNAYLTVDDKLDITHHLNESVGNFEVYHNNLLYKGCEDWVICQQYCEDEKMMSRYTNSTSTKTVLIPKSLPYNCKDTQDVVIRAYGYTAGGIIPDFPL